MPLPNENAILHHPLWQPLLNHWADCVQQAQEDTRQAWGPFDGCSDPQAWRRQWLDVLGTYTDSFLRSPPFLQMLGAHLKQLTQSRLEFNTTKTTSVDPADGATPKRSTGVTPHRVVYQNGSLKLLHYGRADGKVETKDDTHDHIKYAEPVLICFALVNRPSILDLQDERSVVRQLLDRGFDVYLIDWGTPADSDHVLGLYDYVCRFMRDVANVVSQRSGVERLNLLGYCMGGTMSTMFSALHPERVRNLVLMATPIDFDRDEGLLNLWASEEYFDVDALINTYGNCPGEFLQYCFQLMKPVQNFTAKYVALCERLDDSAFLDNFFAMERWASDSIPVAGEAFREYVKLLYQQNRLVKGEMSLRDTSVRLHDITCPLLLLVAQRDHLVPPPSTLALEKHVQSDDITSMSVDAGHIGLAVGTEAHRRLWPEAANWLAEHSTQRS